MRLIIGTLMGALAVSVIALAAPSAAIGPGRVVTGHVERVIYDTFEDEHTESHAKGAHDEGSSWEEVWLVTDDREIITLPSTAAPDLLTGTRVRVTLPPGDGAQPTRVEVIEWPEPRNVGQPAPESRDMPYAVVQVFDSSADVSTQRTATEEDMRRWFVNGVQPYFEREIPGAFRFRVHSSHVLTLDFNVCGREVAVVEAARRELSIPEGVGIVMAIPDVGNKCSYEGMASRGSGEPGQWVLIKVGSPNLSLGAWLDEMGMMVLAHEIGHNLGLDHSRTWTNCLGKPHPKLTRACTLEEYGSRWSVMGNNTRSIFGALDPHQRWQLGSYGAGQLQSITSDAGSAILLADTLPLSVTDRTIPVFESGERILRALHLRDSEGETWLTYRVSPDDWGRPQPRGIVAFMRADWAPAFTLRDDEDDPIQADVEERYSDSPMVVQLASRYDMFQPGSTVGSVNGITITVGEKVTTAYGEGMRVTWSGRATAPSVAPGPPVLKVKGTVVMPGATVAPGPATLTMQGVKSDFAECAIVEGRGTEVVRWQSAEVVPVPGTAWWGKREKNLFGAWSPTLQKILTASLRFPFVGDVAQDGWSAPTTLTVGDYSWRARCVDVDGQVLESATATSVRVVGPTPTPTPTPPPGRDSTPPTVSQGSLGHQGFTPRHALTMSFAKFSDISPAITVSVPGYADAQSGLSRRTGACLSVPAGQAGTCVQLVKAGKGRLTTGAIDRSGNAAVARDVAYDMQLVPILRKSNGQWSVTSRGASPKATGAKVSVKVSGKYFALIAGCGASRGAISVSVNGKPSTAIDLTGVKAAVCQAHVGAIPGGKATVTVHYTRISSVMMGDQLHAVAVLK